MIRARKSDLEGFLFIGDPHLSGRRPGLRKDEYPKVILEKLKWCLDKAREQNLQPVLLGDLFNYPRDNPNWLITRLIGLFSKYQVVGIYGNHDCYANELTDDDSLMMLSAGSHLPLLSEDNWMEMEVDGRKVILAGTPWGKKFPPSKKTLKERFGSMEARVVWITHHDLKVSVYESFGRITPRAIPGVDYVVNGHLHHPVETVEKEGTRWCIPGNIARVKNSDATSKAKPQVLTLRLIEDSWKEEYLEVPHKPFEEVFHDSIRPPGVVEELSGTVVGLRELLTSKTNDGAMLDDFLEANFESLELSTEVRQEILKIKEETANEWKE